MRRLTIRARLTILWGALFIATGACLLGLTYLLVQQSVQTRFAVGGQVSVVVDGTPAPGAAPGSTGGANAPVTSVGGTEASPPPQSSNPSSERTMVRLPGGAGTPIDTYLRSEQQKTVNALFTRGAIALGVVAVVGIGFGWLLAERALRPLATITETARRVADRNLHERIALTGPRDEIKELADTFDSMLERLDRSFDGQRRFVGNASHELRTPLAINRTLIEVALGRPGAPPEMRQLGETLLAVNSRHERLIDGLLTLARSEQGITTHDPVDLADVSRHVVEVTGGTRPRPDVEIRTALRPAPLTGDPVLLERVVQNLVGNAVRYNVPGGWVEVSTRGTGDGVELVVSNTGPVVPGYEVPGLFEPFRRLRDRVGSADGTGLGLSIVRSVALAHGGAAEAAPRDGGGLVVRVTLPGGKN